MLYVTDVRWFKHVDLVVMLVVMYSAVKMVLRVE